MAESYVLAQLRRVVAGPPYATVRKVPEITALFWAIKLGSTAMGESTSDFFVFTVNAYLAVGVACIGLIVALSLQFRAGRYVPWIYWLAVVMVAVFGTMAADVLHVVLHVPYAGSALGFAILLGAIFFVWDRIEHTLSIHTIYPGRREVFYWAAVMATFALGTAAGDFTAAGLGLGYFASLLLFAGLILIPAISYRVFRTGEVGWFWFAYVITRPLGASFADWTGKNKLGGLGLGDGLMALVLTSAIAVLVAWETVRVSGSSRASINNPLPHERGGKT